jgi:hypothetical protein
MGKLPIRYLSFEVAAVTGQPSRAVAGRWPNLRVGWYNHGSAPNDGHMAITLPDGTHAESGGSHGTFELGGSAAGAEDCSASASVVRITNARQTCWGPQAAREYFRCKQR